MEVWGGIECTINKIGEQYFDQLEYAGHDYRREDLQAIADLGIKKLRYPILWEKYQPNKKDDIDWTLLSEKLNYFKANDISIIAGLVHHGSGPPHVNLLNNSFAEGLAQYAKQVALQFPWIEYYTPINEPLTTARFCGLYGLWAPHRKDDRSFLTILINECKATVLAMQAIREINPKAKLVMTEDLGKIHSTSLLKYQADFENQRKWLGLDLLCGKVNANHPLWDYLLDSGISEKELDFFTLQPCIPDILGFNYYITSERLIDEDRSLYPKHSHGGNGKHQYADVEMVRSDKGTISGPYELLKEAWERYHLPMAITEAHIHCSREEQLRWFDFIYSAALRLEKEGVPIKAVTAWALLGAYGWDRLLTVPHGNYEPGIYDIRSGKPRATALTKMIKCLAIGHIYPHPVLYGPGWWERETRIIHGKVSKKKVGFFNSPPILILGKTGTLGNAFARICDQRGLHYELLSRAELNVLNLQQIQKVIREKKPWAIVNATGFVRVDDAEKEKDNCFSINAKGNENLAIMCALHHVKLLTFSTDLVFDGRSTEPYTEDYPVNPLNIYGKSKVEAEKMVLKHHVKALIIRSSTFFGPWDEYNLLHIATRHLQNNQPFVVPDNITISPTYVPDLVDASLDLMIDDECGIWHLANTGKVSPADLARSVAEHIGANIDLVIGEAVEDMDLEAPRPKFSVLQSKKGGDLLPTLQSALDRYFKEMVQKEQLIEV